MTVQSILQNMKWYEYVVIDGFGGQVVAVPAELMQKEVINTYTSNGLVTVLFIKTESRYI